MNVVAFLMAKSNRRVMAATLVAICCTELSTLASTLFRSSFAFFLAAANCEVRDWDIVSRPLAASRAARAIVAWRLVVHVSPAWEM